MAFISLTHQVATREVYRCEKRSSRLKIALGYNMTIPFFIGLIPLSLWFSLYCPSWEFFSLFVTAFYNIYLIINQFGCSNSVFSLFFLCYFHFIFRFFSHILFIKVPCHITHVLNSVLFMVVLSYEIVTSYLWNWNIWVGSNTAFDIILLIFRFSSF